jgi:glycerol-3-phosphate dehydrogenase subunit B
VGETPPIECDLVVIGRGMAGMAATLFAANRGISTVQVGMTGEIIFASGCLDLLAVPSYGGEKAFDDPWAAMDLLAREVPKHPYGRLKKAEIEAGFEEVVSFLNKEGLLYSGGTGENLEVVSPLGTIRHTYYAPQSMWEGIKTIQERDPFLIIDFNGFTDFSATQIAGTLRHRWPNVRSARISFPGNRDDRELIAGDIMAETMELSKNREEMSDAIRPLLSDSQAVGVPAVMGMQGTQGILADLKDRMGVPVFEIPTFPVSVPGLRLNDAFARGLSRKGVKRLIQSRVLAVEASDDATFVVHVGKKAPETVVHARGVVLATGRFWSRGLVADRNGIHEPLFDLPVHQPEKRDQWHRERFLDLRGHPVNRAGVETDDALRPLEASGDLAFERLFAAGAILAHQDWKRMKCGSGLAIGTSYKAIEAFSKMK